MKDLEEGIRYSCEALALCPPGCPDRSVSLNNLAIVIWVHYKESGKMKDFEKGITYNCKALTVYPPGHSGR